MKLHFVSIHKDKQRYPLESDPEYNDYVYAPNPWPLDMREFPRNELWYFFSHPTACGTSTHLTRSLPAHTKGGMPEPRARAFGIHIGEQYSLWAIFLPVCVLVSVTLGVSLWFVPVWLRDHLEDLQGAAMPAGVTTGVATCLLQVLISLLVFRWTQTG